MWPLRVGGVVVVEGEAIGRYDGWLVDDQDRCPVAFRIGRPPSPSDP